MEAMAFIAPSGEAEATGVLTAVPWWSFTKTVLATALLRLSEQSKINLDEAVDGKRYTPAQLLRHEAGLPDYGTLANYHADVEAGRSPWSIEKLLNAAESNRLRYEPGQGWIYSNIGYLEVAQLIEQASDRPLADALADLVFLPAELATARLAATPAELAEVSMGDAVGYHPGWVYHGLVVGTALDAGRLLRALLAGKLIGPAALARMLDPIRLPQFYSEIHPDPAYGMGLMLSAANPLADPIGHRGVGHGSRFTAYARQGTTCVIWAADSAAVDPEAEVIRTLRAANPSPAAI